MADNQVRELARAAADAIRSAHKGDIPRIAMRLGSGLNSVARAVETALSEQNWLRRQCVFRSVRG